MKLSQHTGTEGCRIQPDAACVTGQCLAHRLPSASGRVTTQRSAVVTRPHSGLKCEWHGNIFETCSNASGIMTWLLNKNFKFSNDKCRTACLYSSHVLVLSAATAAKWQTRHLRVVQQVHQRKLRSIFDSRAVPQGLSILDIGHCFKACPFSQASACL